MYVYFNLDMFIFKDKKLYVYKTCFICTLGEKYTLGHKKEIGPQKTLKYNVFVNKKKNK